MKTLPSLITLSLLGLPMNSQATCPQRLAGKYVSSVEYTIMSQVSKPPAYENTVANVRFSLTSSVIRNNTITFVKVFTAYAGDGEIAREIEGSRLPVTFDPKTCTGRFGEADSPIYFVVGDSGKVIKTLKGTTPLSSTITASLGEFTRQ